MSDLRSAGASLLTTVFRDGVGQAFIPVEAAELLATSADVPVFVLVDTFVGHGPVGGAVVDGDDSFSRMTSSKKQRPWTARSQTWVRENSAWSTDKS